MLAKCYYMVSLQAWTFDTILIEGLDTHDEFTKERGEPAKDLVNVPLHDGTLSTLFASA